MLAQRSRRRGATGVDSRGSRGGQAVELAPPPGPRWRTPSGKIELRNAALAEPLPRHLPTHADEDGRPRSGS